MRLDSSSGDLILTTSDGSELRQARPKVYQQAGNNRVAVASSYRLLDHGQAAFALGWRQDSSSLNIKLGNGLFAMKLSPTGNGIYCSLLNGSDSDNGTSVAFDSQHNAWIVGSTSETAFTVGSKQPTPDALVLKVTPDGFFSNLKTFGGSGPDYAKAVTVDLDETPG